MFFVQTRKKLTHGLLNFLEKYAKIMHFSHISYEIFFENFRIVSPPRKNPGYAHEREEGAEPLDVTLAKLENALGNFENKEKYRKMY